MRVADNALGAQGGACVGQSLTALTGLQELNLGCTCLLCCFDGGVVCIAGEGGRECVF